MQRLAFRVKGGKVETWRNSENAPIAARDFLET